MSTHNICFMENYIKLSFNYHQIPSLSVLLEVTAIVDRTSLMLPNHQMQERLWLDTTQKLNIRSTALEQSVEKTTMEFTVQLMLF